MNEENCRTNQATDNKYATPAEGALCGAAIGIGSTIRAQTVAEYLQQQIDDAAEKIIWYRNRLKSMSKQDLYKSVDQYEQSKSLHPPYPF
jgi:hypothetical protein